jgi:hypothetical protein
MWLVDWIRRLLGGDRLDEVQGHRDEQAADGGGDEEGAGEDDDATTYPLW